nr:MAG TPA: hypothetical protein [Caudoviricetes sp.]
MYQILHIYYLSNHTKISYYIRICFYNKDC